MNFKKNLNNPIFKHISNLANEMQIDAYIVGGYVRDLILNRPSKDIDIVLVDINKKYGSIGIQFAERLAKDYNVNITFFKAFGTAQLIINGVELEFVGARKESYSRNSRKPVVENGTFEDDSLRRDFTMNALALSLNANFGGLIDPFGGLIDIEKRIIATPINPDVTYSDDPLRMMRAIRFAAQLNFKISKFSKLAIRKNAHRLKIISNERIIDELHKIFLTDNTKSAFLLMDEVGLLDYILPELTALKGQAIQEGQTHKDNFEHTLTVLNNLDKLGYRDMKSFRTAILDLKFEFENTPIVIKFDKNSLYIKNSICVIKNIADHLLLVDSCETLDEFVHLLDDTAYDLIGDSLTTPIVWMKWVAILHDIGKPKSKRFTGRGWTFDGHEAISVALAKKVFKRLKLPLYDELNYVIKVIGNHERFKIALNAKESAMRRLVNVTQNHLVDSIIFNIVDTSSKHIYKRRLWNSNAWRIYYNCLTVITKDGTTKFKPPIDGDAIMKFYNITPSKPVGIIKAAIKNAILDELIDNSYAAALPFMKEFVKSNLPDLIFANAE